MVTSTVQTALVVDDDPAVRELISRILEREGFVVTTAGDGRSAIKRLDEARPSLLCLDLMLPEASGYDVCEHVLKSEALKGLPILMVSARSTPADRANAEELGVVKYLVKPFNQSDFLDGVRAAMSGGAPAPPPGAPQ